MKLLLSLLLLLLFTNQSTACQLTPISYSFNDIRSHRNIKFSTGKVVQKEKGLGSMTKDIIDAHGNQVLAYRCVFTAFLCNLKYNIEIIAFYLKNLKTNEIYSESLIHFCINI